MLPLLLRWTPSVILIATDLIFGRVESAAVDADQEGYGYLISNIREDEDWCLTAKYGVEDFTKIGFHRCLFHDPSDDDDDDSGLPPIWESDYGDVLEYLTGYDDWEQNVSLSFPFPFEGVDYETVVVVGTNGGLQLGGNGYDGWIPYDSWRYFDAFINDGAPIILPLHSDWDLGSWGTIHFNDFGDRAVFTWNEVGTYREESHLSTFQAQLLKDGKIIFGYNGILDGEGEDLVKSQTEGILVGISGSTGSDDGASDLSAGPFDKISDTVYELWCYNEADTCDGYRPGPPNSAFDLDKKNVVFNPLEGGGYRVSNGVCGDGIADSGEDCDDGTVAVSSTGCTGAACASVPSQMWKFDDEGRLRTSLDDTKCMLVDDGDSLFDGITMRIADCDLNTSLNKFTLDAETTHHLKVKLDFELIPAFCITNRGNNPNVRDSILAKTCRENETDYEWTFKTLPV